MSKNEQAGAAQASITVIEVRILKSLVNGDPQALQGDAGPSQIAVPSTRCRSVTTAQRIEPRRTVVRIRYAALNLRYFRAHLHFKNPHESGIRILYAGPYLRVFCGAFVVFFLFFFQQVNPT
jgi:hypothetical protein